MSGIHTMRLLVSVTSPREALAAVAGGADIIDAKDPLAGAMGALSVEAVRQIHAAVANARTVSAALGDATDEASTEHAAREFISAGAKFVKVGFAGIANGAHVETLIAAAVRGADGAVIAVAYADANRAVTLAPGALLEIAAGAGAAGILVDTADKTGPGLRALMTPGAVATLVHQAHSRNLLVALAGKLSLGDIAFVREAGADIAGVRGTACDGGRTGHVSTERVRTLAELVHRPASPTTPQRDERIEVPREGSPSDRQE